MKKSSVVFLCCICWVMRGGSAESILNVGNPFLFHPSDYNEVDFGYSLALYFNGSYRSLLIGAPSANSSQQGVASPGALYSCDLSTDATVSFCAQLVVDTRDAEDKYVPFIDQDLKDFQRLGESLATRNNNVVVCAPNWHYYERRVSGTLDAPVGICFRSTSLERFEPFSVPYDVTGGNTGDYLKSASCQSGFSSSLSIDNTLILGSPGCYNWEGEAYAQTSSGFTSFGKGFTQEVFGGEDDEEVLWLSNMYLGYSVAEGNFKGQKGIVAGMPRSAQLPREIYSPNSPNIKITNPSVTIHLLEGENLPLWTTLTPPKNDKGAFDSVWLFSYFGYSVAVADIDANGLDDVIVGAPFYHNGTNFDQGAILVFLQRRTDGTADTPGNYHVFVERDSTLRSGADDYGRFGTSIANLGDLNGDGVQDVAVGAPYAEVGKVYIYLGGPNGLSKTPYQIISSSDPELKELNLKAFGAAFAPRFQLEEGTQNDIAIGSPFSDAVVVFRSKVMMEVDWSVIFSQKMDMASECPIGEGSLPCAPLRACLSFSFLENGKKGDTRPIEIALSYDLDSNSFPRRLFFDDAKPTRTTKVFVEFEKVVCFTDTVYTNRQIYNLDAFEITSTIDHIPRNKRDQSTLQTDQKTSSTDFLEIQFECESANISGCVSDLHLKVESSPLVVQVEDARFSILFEISNFGESSFSNKLDLTMDPFLEISGKAEVLEDSSVSPTIDCREFEAGKSQCSLGTFINTNDVLRFRLSLVTSESFLDLENLRSHDIKFQVISALRTLSEIKYPDAATQTIFVALETEPEFYLTRNDSSTDLVTLKEDFEYETPSEGVDNDSVGPKVVHMYEIYNKMNYAIENNNLKIFMPREIDGSDLLFGQIIISPPAAKCSTALQKGYVKDDNKNPNAFGDVIWEVTSCDILFLEPQKSIDIKLDLRLAMKTVIEDIYNPDFDEVRSYVKLESKPLLLGLKTIIVVSNDIGTRIDYGNFVFRLVPKWVYALGAGIGLVVLIVLMCCLRRFNFFKRNKKENFSQENLADAEDEDGEEGEEEETEEIGEVNAMISNTAAQDKEIYDNV